jgi:hypothetical protein
MALWGQWAHHTAATLWQSLWRGAHVTTGQYGLVYRPPPRDDGDAIAMVTRRLLGTPSIWLFCHPPPSDVFHDARAVLVHNLDDKVRRRHHQALLHLRDASLSVAWCVVVGSVRHAGVSRAMQERGSRQACTPT